MFVSMYLLNMVSQEQKLSQNWEKEASEMYRDLDMVKSKVVDKAVLKKEKDCH